MKYEKPPLTFEEQADHLIECGLVADRDVLIQRLSAVNYYRLSGYLYPFRREQSDRHFRAGTTLDDIWMRYTFDRCLRLLMLDAIERIEVYIRTALAYRHAHLYGPFGYTHSKNLPNLSNDIFGNFLARISESEKRSRETFVQHFQSKYGDQHGYLPIWMMVEIMTFGTMLTFYRGAEKPIKQGIAMSFGVGYRELNTWLLTLNAIRNICAHHGRLWNRELGIRPRIPRGSKHPRWQQPVSIRNNRIFGVLTVAKYMLDVVAPQSEWPHRVTALFDEYPDVPRDSMGMTDDWKQSLIWKSP